MMDDLSGGGIGIGGGGGGGSISSKPSTPTGVTASAQSSSSIKISWTKVSGADEYNVYRSTSASGSFSYRGYTTSTSYTDTGLTANTTYYYKVTAENDYGESAQSSYASATTSGSGGSVGSLSGTTWKYEESYYGVTVTYILTFTSSSRVKLEYSMMGYTMGEYNGTYTVSGSKISVDWDAGYSGSGYYTASGNKLTSEEGDVFTKQ